MRKIIFATGEYYHIYNRGVDKRNVFSDQYDIGRFFQSMQEFNSILPIGSIYENSFRKDQLSTTPLVEFVAYCLNPNHYHFLIKQISDKGIEKFMQRLGGGYTKYFNKKYKRNGSLFQGVYKAKHVNSNAYLLHLSVYINGNNQLGSLVSKLSKSSVTEYFSSDNKVYFCNKVIILSQFPNIEAYRVFFESSLKDITLRKQMEKEYDLEA